MIIYYSMFLSAALVAIGSLRIWLRQRSVCSLLMMVGALIGVVGAIFITIVIVTETRPGTLSAVQMNLQHIANQIIVPIGAVLFNVSFSVWAFTQTWKKKASPSGA